MKSFDEVVSPVITSEVPQIRYDGYRRKIGIGEISVSEIVPVSKNRLPEREPTRATAAALLRSPGSAETASGAAVTAAVAPPGPAPGPAAPAVAVAVAVVVDVVVIGIVERRGPWDPVEVSIVVHALHRVS